MKKLNDTTKAQLDMFYEVAPYLIIIISVIIIRLFICSPQSVNGTSMTPTLQDGDMILLYKLTKRFKGLNRFDIVVVKTSEGRLVKRIIGLPGETIKYTIEEVDGKEVGVLYVDGKKIEENFIDENYTSKTCVFDTDLCENGVTLGENEYYVMGDNRGNSKDSRLLGTFTYDQILGTTEIRLFPFSRFGKIDNYEK